jgi:hypothetical protein
MLFSPTIGAAITAPYWFLWVRCPACRTINAIDLRTLDRHRDAAVSSLIPALSCSVFMSNTGIYGIRRQSHRPVVLSVRLALRDYFHARLMSVSDNCKLQMIGSA